MTSYIAELTYTPQFQYLVLTEEECDLIDQEWTNRVPTFGSADGDINELFRMVEKIRYELFNNGGCNDKTDEIHYLNSMKYIFPRMIHPHITYLIDFLEEKQCFNTDNNFDDSYNTFNKNKESDMAIAYSCELSRYVFSILE